MVRERSKMQEVNINLFIHWYMCAIPSWAEPVKIHGVIHCELTMASTRRASKRLLLPSFLAARAGDALRWPARHAAKVTVGRAEYSSRDCSTRKRATRQFDCSLRCEVRWQYKKNKKHYNFGFAI